MYNLSFHWMCQVVTECDLSTPARLHGSFCLPSQVSEPEKRGTVTLSLCKRLYIYIMIIIINYVAIVKINLLYDHNNYS